MLQPMMSKSFDAMLYNLSMYVGSQVFIIMLVA